MKGSSGALFLLEYGTAEWDRGEKTHKTKEKAPLNFSSVLSHH